MALLQELDLVVATVLVYCGVVFKLNFWVSVFSTSLPGLSSGIPHFNLGNFYYFQGHKKPNNNPSVKNLVNKKTHIWTFHQKHSAILQLKLV